MPYPSCTIRLVPLALAAVAMTACVVVPVDPRTGQPIGYPLADGATPHSTTVVMTPPPPPAPASAVLTARLYPLNAQANKSGALTAVVIDQQGGRGSFSVGYAGETLQGQATRVDNGYAAFGRIHGDVLGVGERRYSGQRGIANAAGARGLAAQCEYLITAPGQGTGVCLFSDGAHYQMHFGA
jgi:hypothetical protein